MFADILLLLCLLGLLVFVVPAGWKWAVSLAVLLAGIVVSGGEVFRTLTSELKQTSTGLPDTMLFGEPPLLEIDLLSALFVLIISVGALAAMIYARGYLKVKAAGKSPVQVSLHYFCLLVIYFAMLVVVMARDGFLFLFAWEMMTLSSFLLVLFDGENPKVRRAALNYLILMHVGFFFLLAGFVTLHSAGLPATFDSLSIYFARHSVIPLFVLFLVGFGMKAGLFPLHIWLPEAHPAAPAHVSALMSGVMIKMGVYGLMRVTSYIGHDLYTVGLVLFVVGIVTGLWGVIFAALQNEIKKLLAYSSIENVGIILLALGLSLLARSQGNRSLALCAMAGAVLHSLNHSFFKSLLYLGAGNVAVGAHTTVLDRLGGLGRRMPVTAILFLLGSLALCALPPLNGFVSEFLIFSGLFSGIAANGTLTVESLFGLLALAFIGGLSVVALSKLYGVAFQGQPRTVNARDAREVDGWMLGSLALPLAGMLFVGLGLIVVLPMIYRVSGELLGIVNASSYYEMSASVYWTLSCVIWTLCGVTLTVWLLRRVALRRRPVAESPTWGCGFTAPSPRMQYTGESFTEGLESISARVMNRVGHGVDLSAAEIFPTSHDFEITRKDKVDQLVSRWWLIVLRRINTSMAMLRTGKVNHYILFAMLFLLLVLLLSVFDWL